MIITLCLSWLVMCVFVGFVCYWTGYDYGKVVGTVQAWNDSDLDLQRKDDELSVYAQRAWSAENSLSQIDAILHPNSGDDLEEETEDDR